jgi:hypothetical protein
MRHGGAAARGLLLALVLFVGMPVSVASAARPVITAAPEVSGGRAVGETMRAVDARWRGADATARWSWYRCDTGLVESCRRIRGARRMQYEVGPDDVGRRLRVRLLVRNRDGFEWVYSMPSAAVAPRPPAPESPPALDPPPGLIRPFPSVRIRGVLTATGARVTLLTVTAPAPASIALECRGRSCPRQTWSRVSGRRVTRLTAFERPLRAGTRLAISVTQPGRIGKHTNLRIRVGKPPLRRDRCLYPGTSRPEACPVG